MPLLQGQPFKLIKPPDVIPLDSELYTIQHTGEKFLNKSDYEDRLALYSQTIWMCQCTGHSGMTHKEAWMSEAKTRVAAKNAVPIALQKPLLSLVHHSLSPLEQLIDAASILCHSQFHVGEEVLLLSPKQTNVKIVNCKENSKLFIESGKTSHQSIPNGLHSDKESSSLLNGNANGISKNSETEDISPGKENQAKEIYASKDDACKRDMLPKLYDVITIDDHEKIENVPSKNLSRPYKIPSKDQLRLFIRSCALRHRGSTCTPWVVSDDLVKKFNISNKLPLFLSSSKRKAQSLADEAVKRPKSESSNKEMSSKVPPLVIKSDGSHSPQKMQSPEIKKKDSMKSMIKNGSSSQHSFSAAKMGLKSSTWTTAVTKHPLSMGKPKVLPRPSAAACTISPAGSKAMSKLSLTGNQPLPVSKMPNAPRRRGRPPLSKEEKERNKRLREESLLDFSNKLTNPEHFKIIKIKPNTAMPPPPTPPPPQTSSYLQPSNAVVSASYKSPIKRAVTPEAIMKLPIMRRYVHEHKTIKGVLGQFRRYAYTMDLVLSKLSSTQIELIPDENLKQDLLTRQKKVLDKKFFEKLTPEEKKQFLKDKARTVALERWKERKLKNLKVEDKLVPGLEILPEPTLVETPELISNSYFGDIVMITEFIKCFRELLLGEEKFRIVSTHLMEAIVAGVEGYQVIADMICCFLPTIIHDDISKNCKEIGVPISGIPITYQTAHELARLCLRKQEEEENDYVSEDNYQLGKEKNELSDELLDKLEHCELWELSCQEIIAILKALVHKTLTTAAISVYVEEIEEKVLQSLRERRKFLKQVQKEQRAEVEKRKEERKQNKIAKDDVPKKKRGRPKGYSPKLGLLKLPDMLPPKAKVESMSETIHKRRISAELSKKEKAESLKLEKERQKQMEEIQKRHSVDRKYEEIVFKRDNLLRRTPIGFDRDHNRYWIFHTTTPGLYVEKGWVDHNTDYNYSLDESYEMVSEIEIKTEPKIELSEDVKPSSLLTENYEGLTSTLVKSEIKEEVEEEDKLKFERSPQIMEVDEDNRPLSTVKSKLTLTPMKMTFRGRPPKETYVLVDEDTQTFPVIGENKWYCYRNMDEVKNLLSCLSDQGQRESQLIAAININRDRLQYHFNKKPEPLKLSEESANRLKESLKGDIIQIARELIEGWLGGIPNFEEWEANAQEADDVISMGHLLIDVQKHMQIKNLKSIMTPVKKEIPSEGDSERAQPEYEDVEGPDVEIWREAVRSCRTYSRLHVLVGLFDSCIKWEKSMATRKCKVCRNKMKETPLVMCGKCENSYHWKCLRPPLKEDPGESWACPACMPKKTRREESQPIEQDEIYEDQDERDDPTFSLNKRGRPSRGGGRPVGRPPGKTPPGPSNNLTKKRKYNRRKCSPNPEKECSVCLGRIGLICCSKCSRSFHSECHDPPLMSRARKDWVCGICLNPSRGKFILKDARIEEPKPTRRNIFGNVEDDITYRRRTGNKGPRDNFGRFLPGRSFKDGGEEEFSDRGDNEEEEEGDKRKMSKFGRSIRGAKAKALENLVDKYSRRSSRNHDKKRNYKDESEHEDSGGGESDENDNDSEDQSEGGEGEEEENVAVEESDQGENDDDDVIEVSDGENDSEDGRNKGSDESESEESSDEESNNVQEEPPKSAPKNPSINRGNGEQAKSLSSTSSSSSSSSSSSTSTSGDSGSGSESGSSSEDSDEESKSAETHQLLVKNKNRNGKSVTSDSDLEEVSKKMSRRSSKHLK